MVDIYERRYPCHLAVALPQPRFQHRVLGPIGWLAPSRSQFSQISSAKLMCGQSAVLRHTRSPAAGPLARARCVVIAVGGTKWCHGRRRRWHSAAQQFVRWWWWYSAVRVSSHRKHTRTHTHAYVHTKKKRGSDDVREGTLFGGSEAKCAARNGRGALRYGRRGATSASGHWHWCRVGVPAKRIILLS